MIKKVKILGIKDGFMRIESEPDGTIDVSVGAVSTLEQFRGFVYKNPQNGQEDFTTGICPVWYFKGSGEFHWAKQFNSELVYPVAILWEDGKEENKDKESGDEHGED